MPRMRSKTRVLNSAAARGLVTLCAGVAVVCTVPAQAADEAPVKAKFGVERVAAWAKQTGRKERERAQGPFVPLVGPVDYGTAENAFGAPRSGHIHAGQDMFAPPGTPEVAVTDAVVAETGSDGGQGNYVYLYDPKLDRTYVYMHMIEPAKVKTGERVHAGQLLGGVGCTGSCWGDHLHFEVRDGRGYTGEARDPMPLLRQWRSIDKPR
jgi:murein DD-endopeptidase MepM/ murein hydrolase activator NlpD